MSERAVVIDDAAHLRGNAIVKPQGERERVESSRACFIGADHPAFAGHFPGQPILPGVPLLAAVLEAVRSEPASPNIVGAEPRFVMAKFHAPVGPDASLTIDFESGPNGLAWSVRDGDRIAASGQLAPASALRRSAT